MVVAATFGLLANLFSVFILIKDKIHNLNVKVVYMHLPGDTLSSVAVIAGSIIIRLFKIYWIDPVITILVGIYIFWHAWRIVKQTVDILMQAVPPEINLEEIREQVENMPGKNNIHHVDAWKLDDIQTYFEAHLKLSKKMDIADAIIIRKKVEQLLQEKFGFRHITLQPEFNCCQGESEIIKIVSETKTNHGPDIL